MKSTVQLESKDVRAILAKFFGVPLEKIIPNRYSFSIEGMTAEEVEKKIKG